MIAVEGLWKIFGGRGREQARALAADGMSRSEILDRTGCTIGVRDVSFAVSRGETFVVMGLSGSGKSTLIRCLSRLVEPTGGTIGIDGVDLLAMPAEQLRELRRTRMAMVFQHFGLFPNRRVIDNVAYGLEVQGIARAARHQRSRRVIESVGLAGWELHFPQQLSGGMQQRVGLARALALDPEILFFDEPFSALDPLIRRDMQDELLRLQRDLHCTIVFITHDFDEALRLGDRIAIMKDGVFDQVGTPEAIVTTPATDYVREFTRDVTPAAVVRAGTIAVVGDDDASLPHRVPADEVVEHIVPIMLAGADRVAVERDGAIVGSIDRSAVLGLFRPR
jgi:glycine betaine/proline transport system ATP-binding protein